MENEMERETIFFQKCTLHKAKWSHTVVFSSNDDDDWESSYKSLSLTLFKKNKKVRTRNPAWGKKN